MTAFITRFSRNSPRRPRPEPGRAWYRAALWLLLRWALGLGVAALALAQVTAPVEIAQWKAEQSDDALLVSAQVRFDLPSAVEDALQKGIPLTFTVEAEVYRERWYWFDRRISAALRSYRVVYQPLSRRWRVTVAGSGAGASAPALSMNQGFESLSEAMAHVKRVAGWRVADAAQMEEGVQYRVELRYRLDVSQLALPMQIGTLGQSDWNLTTSASQVLRWERGSP
ncbi:MAG: DUF4390 domain-containing protein [Rhodoferax sp.]